MVIHFPQIILSDLIAFISGHNNMDSICQIHACRYPAAVKVPIPIRLLNQMTRLWHHPNQVQRGFEMGEILP